MPHTWLADAAPTCNAAATIQYFTSTTTPGCIPGCAVRGYPFGAASLGRRLEHRVRSSGPFHEPPVPREPPPRPRHRALDRLARPARGARDLDRAPVRARDHDPD